MSDSQQTEADELNRLREENTQLRQEVLGLRQFIDAMQNLMDAVETPRGEAEVLELLDYMLENALRTINATDGSLLVVDEDTRDLVFVLAKGAVPTEELAWKRLPPGKGIAGWVVDQRRPTIVNDAQTDERFYDDVDQTLDFHTQSILAAPIIGGGRVLGVIEILNKSNGRLFSAADQTLLTILCRFSGELLYTLVRDEQPLGNLGPPPTNNGGP